MKNVMIITGIEAREQGLYTDGAFVLEQAEESYDAGIWIREPGKYAAWFATFETLYDYLNQ